MSFARPIAAPVLLPLRRAIGALIVEAAFLLVVAVLAATIGARPSTSAAPAVEATVAGVTRHG